MPDEIVVRDQALIEALRAAGLRMTRPRKLILQILEQGLDHPDAQQIHLKVLEKAPGVALSTVYRTLSALEEQGAIHRHGFEGGASRFERAADAHHDHLIDVESGEVIEFSSPEIEALQEKIAAELGYTIVDHKFEIYVRKVA